MRGWDIEVRESEARLHARTLAREEARKGASVVFACGGDGTVNEVINGLAGTGACLGVLRAGTGNVFGKEVSIPRRIEDALEVLDGGREYQFDLGVARGSVDGADDDGSRLFLLMAGVGFDGAVVRHVPSRPKRLLGTTSYLLWGAAEAVRFKSRPVALVVDGERLEIHSYWLLFGNTRSYGGVADVAMNAVVDDGLLDVYVFSGEGFGWMVGMSARIALKRHQSARDVTYALARDVFVETPGLAVQADGEYFGETPMRFEVAQRTLRVLLAAGAGDHLLGGSAANR